MSEAIDDQPKAWVLWWQYHDRSGHGFIRVFDDVDKANAMLAMFIKHAGTDREYKLDPVEAEYEY